MAQNDIEVIIFEIILFASDDFIWKIFKIYKWIIYYVNRIFMMFKKKKNSYNLLIYTTFLWYINLIIRKKNS